MRKTNSIAIAALVFASVAWADSERQVNKSQHEEGGRLHIYQKQKIKRVEPEPTATASIVSSLKTMNDDLRILEERQRIIFVTLESFKR